jgi:hypothetical protein
MDESSLLSPMKLSHKEEMNFNKIGILHHIASHLPLFVVATNIMPFGWYQQKWPIARVVKSLSWKH